MELQPDIRFVLWSGKKFIYFGREDFRKKESMMMDLYDKVFTYTDTMFLNILPVGCMTKIAIDGSGSASLSFVAPDGKYNFRYQSNMNMGNIIPSRKPFIYRDALIDRFVKPHINYYEKMGIFSEDYINNPDGYSEPVFVFTPPQLIWIEMKRSNLDGWRRVFTGIIQSVTENDAPGKGREISIICYNLLQLALKIPLCYEKQIVPFAETILPDDKNFRIFWAVYMMSVFMDKDTIGFDPLADITFSDLYLRFGKVFNRSVGALGKNDYDELKNTLGSINKEVWDPLGRTLESSDIDTFKNICEANSFYRFKLFSTDEVDTYEGDDNSVPDEIGYENLFQPEKRILGGIGPQIFTGTVGRIKVNKIIKDLEFRDAINHKTKMPMPFQKMFKISMGSYFKPKIVMMSNIIRKFSTTYGFMSHTDPFANWIVEYPNFNAMPTLSNSGLGQGILGDEAYNDNDARYIFQRFDCESINYTISPDKFVSFVELPFSFNIVGLKIPEILQDKFTGRSWGSIEQILYYGLNEVNMDALYFNIGTMGVGDKEREFLYKMTDCFKERLNAEVWSVSTSHKMKPELQVGRIAIIIPQERKYFVSEVSNSIQVGKSSSTTLSLTHGRTLDEKLTNPWEYFLENIEDVEPVASSDKTKSPSDIKTQTEEPVTDYTKNSTNEGQTKSQVKETTGTDLKNPTNVIETIKRMHLEPMPVKDGFAKSFYDVSYDFVGCDERILLAIGELYYYMMFDWFLNNDKIKVNKVVDLKLYIFSIVRSKATKDDKSRHVDGRAIDIGGLRLTYEDEDNITKILEVPFRGEKSNIEKERYIPDAMFNFIGTQLKVNGHQWYCNNDAYPISEDKNISYFKFFPDGCLALPGYDCDHNHHIHLSVGKNTI